MKSSWFIATRRIGSVVTLVQPPIFDCCWCCCWCSHHQSISIRFSLRLQTTTSLGSNSPPFASSRRVIREPWVATVQHPPSIMALLQLRSLVRSGPLLRHSRRIISSRTFATQSGDDTVRPSALAKIHLEDGTTLTGRSFGCHTSVEGEVCIVFCVFGSN